METTKAKEFKKRTKGLSKLVKIEIEEYIKDFFKDNNINMEEWDNDYRLPKYIIYSILQEIAKNYYPPYPTKRDKDVIKQITNNLNQIK